MIKKFADKWFKHKDKLEDYFRKTSQEEYDEYEKIVKALFDNVINQENEFDSENFNTDEITVIDNGSWQGTQIFLLHRDIYQPSTEDYIYTDTYYGSCSGCDTLQAIRSDGESWGALPTESQIKDYMALALNLLEKIHFLSDDKKLKLSVFYKTDEYGDTRSEWIENNEHNIIFGVHDLYECPEDAIIGRDLFDSEDYIKAINKGIELANLGYSEVSGIRKEVK